MGSLAGIILLIGFAVILFEIIGGVFSIPVDIAREKKEKKKERDQKDAKTQRLLRSKCKHGIAGAKVNTANCNKCQKEFLNINKKVEAAKIENERLIKIDNWNQDAIYKSYNRCEKSINGNFEQLLKCSPYEFEERISSLYEKLGYSTKLTPKSGDLGKDIVANKDGKRFFIECKQYAKDNKVGRPEIQQLFGAMTAEGVDGIFVTTSEFSDPAREYIVDNKIPIELINGYKIKEMTTQLYGNDLSTNYSIKCSCENIIKFKIKDFYESTDEKCKKCGKKVGFVLYFIDGRLGETDYIRYGEHNAEQNAYDRIIEELARKDLGFGSKEWEKFASDPDPVGSQKTVYRTMSEWREYLRHGYIDSDKLDNLNDEQLTAWLIENFKHSLPIIK